MAKNIYISANDEHNNATVPRYIEYIVCCFQTMCKLQYFVQNMSYTASIEVLTVISMERYFAIIYPMRSKQMTTLCRLRVIVCILWLVAAAYSVPYLFMYDTKVSPFDPNQAWCIIVKKFEYFQINNTVHFLLCYAVPLILITAIYIHISIVLWKSSKPDSIEKNSKLASNIFKNKKQSKKSMQEKGMKLVTIVSKKEPESKRLYNPLATGSGIATSSDDAMDSPKQKQHVGNLAAEQHNTISDKENSSESFAEDYEDNWPGAPHKKEKVNKVRQKFTFQKKDGHMDVVKPGNVRKDSNVTNGAPCIKPNQHHSTTYAVRVSTKVSRSGKNKNALMARRKVIRLLIAVIVSFAVCVLPYNVRMLWTSWGTVTLSYTERLIAPITFLILYFNSALNPMLYAFLSENFRRSLREVVTCQTNRQHMLQSGRSVTSLKTMNSAL